jgi:hypothetical protein
MEILKIEPWFVNGWQSYGKFNKALACRFLYRPNGWLSLLGNQYYGTDALFRDANVFIPKTAFRSSITTIRRDSSTRRP